MVVGFEVKSLETREQTSARLPQGEIESLAREIKHPSSAMAFLTGAIGLFRLTSKAETRTFT